MGITDEMLMAYADGELSATDVIAVERALAEDELLATRLSLFIESRVAVKRAYNVAPAVPTDLEARVSAVAEADAAARKAAAQISNVVECTSRPRLVPFWQLPAAASIALAIGASSGWLASPRSDDASGLQVSDLSDPAIVMALNEVPSGERKVLEGGAEFAAIATFHGGEDQLCREFEHDRADGKTVLAVACRVDNLWDVRFALAVTGSDSGGYAPASSLETLDTYLSATGAGAPLSIKDEVKALRATN